MDRLENYCLNITDGEHGSVIDDNNGKYYLLSNKNMINGEVVITPEDRKISEESFFKINKRTKLSKDDVLISTVGTIGKVALVEGNLNYDFQRSVGILKCNTGVLLPKFLYYYLNNSYIQNKLINIAKGAIQKCIFINDLKNLEVSIPSIPLQKKISEVLAFIDSKIKLNNKINAELENMAKTLYDYWFVQFDFPDEKGRPYKSANGKMVYNEVLKREIPLGWEVRSLYDIATYINGLACQKFRPTDENSYNVIKIKELHTGFNEETEKVRKSIPSKYLVNDGDILFSWSATLEVHMWTGGTGVLNQHIFNVKSKEYPKSFCYYLLNEYVKVFKKIAETRKTTMGHITIDHLKQAYVLVPPLDLIHALDNKIKPIFESIIIHHKEQQSLTNIRDFLLPLLMNGQVTVSSEH